LLDLNQFDLWNQSLLPKDGAFLQWKIAQYKNSRNLCFRVVMNYDDGGDNGESGDHDGFMVIVVS
jgi:hypothetical protein